MRTKLVAGSGPEGIRTPCLLNAIQALSQLSYRPISPTFVLLELAYLSKGIRLKHIGLQFACQWS